MYAVDRLKLSRWEQIHNKLRQGLHANMYNKQDSHYLIRVSGKNLLTCQKLDPSYNIKQKRK